MGLLIVNDQISSEMEPVLRGGPCVFIESRRVTNVTADVCLSEMRC